MEPFRSHSHFTGRSKENPQIIKSQKSDIVLQSWNQQYEAAEELEQMDTALTVWKADILRGCGKRCADRKQKILKIRWNRVSGKIP